MGAGLCAPRRDQDNLNLKAPVAYQSPPKLPQQHQNENNNIQTSTTPATTNNHTTTPLPLPMSPISPTSITNQTDKTVTQNSTQGTLTIDNNVATNDSILTTLETTATTTTPLPIESPNKWDDWDEEEDSTPTQQVSSASDATTNSPSSFDADQSTRATTTTTTTTTGDDKNQDTDTDTDIDIAKGNQVGVSIGGSNAVLRGPGNITCPAMLCTKCDHDVFFKIGYKWSTKVDYIFVRNFGGVNEKLQQELIHDEKTTAYCCQCCWQNIASETLKKLSPWGVPAGIEGGSGAPGENLFWIVKS